MKQERKRLRHLATVLLLHVKDHVLCLAALLFFFFLSAFLSFMRSALADA